MRLWKTILSLFGIKSEEKQEEKIPVITVNIREILEQQERERQQKEVLEKIKRIDEETGLVHLPTENVKVFNQFQVQHRGLLFKFMLKKMRPAIVENRPYVDLFRMGNTARIARVHRENYGRSLDEMLEYFVKTEEYEYAAQVRDLLAQYKGNTLSN